MPGVRETRRLPYTAEQMFDLVADVARYDEFLPWVVAVRVRSDSETEMVADMLVGFKHLREKFTSRVEKKRPEHLEVHQVMDDMRCAEVDFLTMGQYLQPTPKHAKVADFVTPQVFDAYGAIARAKGFLQVASSPLTRSSYHAGEDFAQMKAAREAKLAKQRA